VFFRLLAAEGGPPGAYSQPLTAGRSMACDRALFPPMALAFISGRTPSPEGGEVPFSRLVWAQDTGGAIKGAGRLDLFYGSGQAAGRLAGRMKYPGQFFFLAPKE
jgi:membrane-bound lytic murein transglycosylase A